VVQQVLATRQAVYLDDALVPDTAAEVEHQAFGAQPIFSRDGRVVGVLSVWRSTAEHGWTASERDLIGRAASTIGLVMERTEAAHTLEQQNAELLTQAQILKNFAELSRELGLVTDRYTLIRQALAIVREALPPSEVVYLEPEGDAWVTRVQLGEPGREALQGLAGLEATTVSPELTRPWTTRLPLYQDRSGQEEAVTARAVLPVVVAGVPSGCSRSASLRRTAGRPGTGRCWKR